MATIIDEDRVWPDAASGKPIVDGKIFVGSQNNNPTTGYPDSTPNAITIYSDRDLSVVLPNPVSTGSDGRATSKIWIPDVRYSIVVWDANDTQQYINLDNGTGSDGANPRYYDDIDKVLLDLSSIAAGDVIVLKDGPNGGGGTWDVVLGTTVTNNGYGIYDLDGTLSIVMRPDSGYIYTMPNLLKMNFVDGLTYQLIGSRSANDTGGGKFVASASASKTLHNGITIIDPDKTPPADWSNLSNVTDWFTAAGSGTGVYVRLSNDLVNIMWAGWVKNGSEYNLPYVLEKAMSISAVRFPPGTHALAPGEVTIPNGSGIIGDKEDFQGGGVIFTRASDDYSSFFVTDETDNTLSGIVLRNFKIQGGSSSTWSDVEDKWAITSHYPFTQLSNIAIEDTTTFFGNGVRLHNDGGQSSMGAWSSVLRNIRFVGTTGTTASNGQIGFDFAINGGEIIGERLNVTKADIGIWVRKGENIDLINCGVNSVRCGDPGDRHKASLIVGEPNAKKRVRGLTFTGYIEAVGRGAVLQNCTGVKISGYHNALRTYNPDNTSNDGFIYINSTAKGTVIDSADVETQYQTQSVIYSEAEYAVTNSRIFRNITNSDGVPQSRFAGNVLTGTYPQRSNVAAFRVDSTETSTAITNMTDSSGEIQVTATAHGFTTGDYAWIDDGVVGITNAANSIFRVTVVDANNVTLDGSLFEGTYTSGGNIYTITDSIDETDLIATAVYDPPNLASMNGTTTTITATGVDFNDKIDVTFSLDLQGMTITPYVQSAGTIAVRFFNSTGGAIDLASGTLTARVKKIPYHM